MLDKIKAYKDHGYNFKLILNHIEYNENSLPEQSKNVYNKKYKISS